MLKMSDDVYDVYDDARKELSSNTTYPIPYREEYAETRSVFHLHHRSNSVKRGVKLHACVYMCPVVFVGQKIYTHPELQKLLSSIPTNCNSGMDMLAETPNSACTEVFLVE